MEILRKLRWFFYPSVIIFVFLFASYCTFPEEVVRRFVDYTIFNAAMAVGPKNHGFPDVKMEKASLWRGSGVSVSGLKLSWPTPNKMNPINVQIDSLKGRVALSSLLSSTKKISILGQFYGGKLDSHFKIRQPNTLLGVELSLTKLNLAKIDLLEAALGSQLRGVLDIQVDVESQSQLSKDGTGLIKLILDNAAYGPGSLNVPMGGFVSNLSVPLINLGKLNIEMNLAKGKLDSKVFSLKGGDLEGEMKLAVELGRVPQLSRLDGSGWFSLKKEFVASNETFKMLFDLIPELRTAQQGDGKVGFSIRGIFGRPYFKLESYKSDNAKS
ncbi:MAG: type II secretion system protein GspN [Myxococcales bacterium]|nr:type II secretion system protein GspN [Myxococcales bacterium]USN49891.1 MAG: type II secretion system protein GspN [Myxococcales bacterium]